METTFGMDAEATADVMDYTNCKVKQPFEAHEHSKCSLKSVECQHKLIVTSFDEYVPLTDRSH